MHPRHCTLQLPYEAQFHRGGRPQELMWITEGLQGEEVEAGSEPESVWF
jgi:hypothetical protein